MPDNSITLTKSLEEIFGEAQEQASPANRPMFTDPKAQVWVESNPLGDLLSWAGDKKPYDPKKSVGEQFVSDIKIGFPDPFGTVTGRGVRELSLPSSNLVKTATTLGIYLIPPVGIPLVAGQVIADPAEAAKGAAEMMWKTFQFVTGGAEATDRFGTQVIGRQDPATMNITERLMVESLDEVIFGGMLAFGIGKGIKAGYYKVKGKKTGAVDPLSVTKEEIDAIAEKAHAGARESFEFTTREEQITALVPRELDATLAAMVEESLKRNSFKAPTDPLGIDVAAKKVSISKETADLPKSAGTEQIPESGKFHKPDVERVGLSNAQQEIISRISKSEGQRRSRVDAMVRALDQGLDKTAMTTATNIIRDPRHITTEELMGMVAKLAELEVEINAKHVYRIELTKSGKTEKAGQVGLEMDVLQDAVDVLFLAAEKGGSVQAEAFGARGVLVELEDLTKISYVRSKSKKLKGDRLTANEQAKIERQYNINRELEAEVAILRKADEIKVVEIKRLEAEKMVTVEVARAKQETRASNKRGVIRDQRAQIQKDLVNMGFQLHNAIGLPVDALYKIGQLATTYIREGALTLGDVVAKVRRDFPQFTEMDVYDGLNTKNPTRINRVITETKKHEDALIAEGQLLSRIDQLVNRGIFDNPPAKPIPKEVIKRLRNELRLAKILARNSGMDGVKLEKAIKTISELQDMLENNWSKWGQKKDPPIVKTEDLLDATNKIKELERRLFIRDQLADIAQQRRTGIYKIPDPKEPKWMSPELEKAEVNLMVSRRQLRRDMQDLAPWSKSRKFGEAVNTLRTLKATADMSAVLRQGLVLSIAHPVMATEAFKKSFKAFFSKNTAEQIHFQIINHPNQWLRDRANLELSEVGGGFLRGEEYFASELVKSKAAKWVGMKAVVEASERHMTSYLNMIRASSFDYFLKKYPNATSSELAAWADYINKATGRGDLGRFAVTGQIMSTVFFAPKFAVSRFQTPWTIVKHWGEPRVRNLIARDMALTVGVGNIALGLAKLAGAEVGYDPNDSDFGKVRIGNVHIDFFAGFQQPARLITRIGLVATDAAGWTGTWRNASETTDPYDLLERFVEYKASPVFTIARELAMGESIVGEKRTPWETGFRALMPMMVETIYDAYVEEDIGAAILSTPEFWGMSISVFPDSEGKTRRKIRKLRRQGKPLDANNLRIGWNARNPNDRILEGWMYDQPLKTQ